MLQKGSVVLIEYIVLAYLFLLDGLDQYLETQKIKSSRIRLTYESLSFPGIWRLRVRIDY